MFALLTQLQFAKKLRQTDPAKLYSWYYDALPGKIIIFYVMTYGTICVFLSEGQRKGWSGDECFVKLCKQINRGMFGGVFVCTDDDVATHLKKRRAYTWNTRTHTHTHTQIQAGRGCFSFFFLFSIVIYLLQQSSTYLCLCWRLLF